MIPILANPAMTHVNSDCYQACMLGIYSKFEAQDTGLLSQDTFRKIAKEIAQVTCQALCLDDGSSPPFIPLVSADMVEDMIGHAREFAPKFSILTAVATAITNSVQSTWDGLPDVGKSAVIAAGFTATVATAAVAVEQIAKASAVRALSGAAAAGAAGAASGATVGFGLVLFGDFFEERLVGPSL